MLIWLMALVLACHYIPTKCLCPEDFVDKWWQVELSTGPAGNCYYFAADGHLVEGDGTDNWPIGQWELDYLGECQYMIISDETEIKILGIESGCLAVEYEGEQYSVCECQL